MLSPITVYSVYEEASGKKKTKFFDQNDPAFSILIEKMFKRYVAFLWYGTGCPVIFYHIGPIINAWGGTYEVQVPQN